MSGDDGRDHRDRRAWVRAIDAMLSGQEDATALGLFRVLFVALLTVVYVGHAGAVTEYFSSASMLHGSWARDAFPSRFSLFFFIDDPAAVLALFWLGAVAHAAWMLGAGTRISSAVAMLLWVSMMGRAPLLYAYPDHLAVILGLLLALMPAGRGLSVDAWWRMRRDLPPRTVPVWCRRILQLQIAIVYTATGLEKTGKTWTEEGTAIYYTLVNPYNRHFDLGAQLAALQPWVLRPLTYVVLAWEVSFLGFWGIHFVRDGLRAALRPEPPRWLRYMPDLRWLFLGFGLLMHLGIQTMLYVVHFSWLMIVTYSAFLEPAEARALLRRLPFGPNPNT